jgi:hypothetical protein
LSFKRKIRRRILRRKNYCSYKKKGVVFKCVPGSRRASSAGLCTRCRHYKSPDPRHICIHLLSRSLCLDVLRVDIGARRLNVHQLHATVHKAVADNELLPKCPFSPSSCEIPQQKVDETLVLTDQYDGDVDSIPMNTLNES